MIPGRDLLGLGAVHGSVHGEQAHIMGLADRTDADLQHDVSQEQVRMIPCCVYLL